MVVTDADMNSQGEVESPLQSDQQEANRNNPFASLGRQSSIYSLTLDEFQHTLCDSGKNFGSMNMDEFLSSIWNAEENQVIVNSNYNSTNNNINNSGHLKPLNEASREKGIRKQPSLPRQGSLTIPSQLCRKTVDEVWSEIHKGQQRQQLQQQQSGNIDNNDNFQNTESTHRQPTFGEMTLEDFLVKAGIVREACPMPPPPPASAGATQQHKQYMYPNSNPAVPPSFVARPVMGSAGGGGGAGNVVAPYPAVGPGGGSMGDPPGYPGNGKRDTGYPPTAVCYGGRVVNGGGGYGVAPQTLGMAAPVSPSSDGLGTSENSGGQFGMEMGMLRGRKRIIDGPVEKVVERRQRRMIKNRESAARSRARKQAYTVELEAELNQLREENNHLRQALSELERRRKQQCFEELNAPFQTKAQKAKEKLRALRRNQSCPM